MFANAASSRAVRDCTCSDRTMPSAVKNAGRKRSEMTSSPAIANQGFTSGTASPVIKATSGSAAGVSLRTLERGERFDVMGIREEVEEVQRGEAPARRDQPARVPGKGYGIAGQVGNHFFRPLGD